MSNFEKFKRYAIKQHIHDGPVTIAALEQVYLEHKGSRYADIVEIFKKQGSIDVLSGYIVEMQI
jgi:hypothetical protein